MQKPIIDFKKLINSKKFLITVSVILSIVIWFVAMIVRNPIMDQVFTDIPVSVTVENTSVQNLGLGIVSDVSNYKTSVTLRGPNYIVSKLKNTDFALSASVEEVNKPGTYSLSVTGTRNSDVSGYSFASIEPAFIDVTFDYIDTKDFKVTPKVVGVTAKRGLIAEAPVISNKKRSEITIKGPRNILSEVDSVGSLVEFPDNVVLSSTKTYESNIVLYNRNGQILYKYDTNGSIYDRDGDKVENNQLTLSFTSVNVIQPISKKASLDVKVKFRNLPSGINAKSDLNLFVDHSKATVIGTPEVVSKMDSIELSPIDFREISSKSKGEYEVSAALPDGVKLADNIEFFTVKMDLGSFSDKTFDITDIKYKGLKNKLYATSPGIKNVKICGPSSVIANLTADELYAEIDLSDKTAGEHTVDVKVKSSGHNSIWQVGDYTSAVTISKK